MVVGEQLIGLLTGVPTGQGDDTHDPRIVDEVGVQVGLAGNRQLEHDPGVVVKGVDVLTDVPVQQLLGLLLACGVDVHLGLEDRHQTSSAHLIAQLELLIHDPADTHLVVIDDDRAFLGAEDVLVLHGAVQQLVQTGDGLHHLDVVVLIGQALVDLEKGDDPLALPQEVGRRHALDLTIHRHLEEDRSKNVLTGECRAGDDPGTHLVHEIEHAVLVVAIGRLLDAIGTQGLGGRTARLIQCCDETRCGVHALQLLGVHDVSSNSSLTPVTLQV